MSFVPKVLPYVAAVGLEAATGGAATPALLAAEGATAAAGVYAATRKSPTAPAPPGVPNPNAAANAAQNQTDSMRMRRGLLANIYAGSNPTTNAPAAVGKTTLGT